MIYSLPSSVLCFDFLSSIYFIALPVRVDEKNEIQRKKYLEQRCNGYYDFPSVIA